MYLNELLQKLGCQTYQLLIQHYSESKHQDYYTETPIQDTIWSEIDTMKYIVLKPKFKPIDIGRNWTHWNLNVIIVTTYEELLKHYSKNQLDKWLIWLDNEVRKEL